MPPGGVEEGQPIRVAYPVTASPVLVAAIPLREEEVSSSYVQPDGTRITETKHPDGTSTIVRETTLRGNNHANASTIYQPLAPTGHFRNGMCDCFEVFCSGRFWVSLSKSMRRFCEFLCAHSRNPITIVLDRWHGVALVVTWDKLCNVSN